jgi:hypothetical protein
VHTVIGTAANVNDVTQAGALVHGEEADVFADAGYQGVAKREVTLPLFGVVLNPRFTRPFFAVPRTSVVRTASG